MAMRRAEGAGEGALQVEGKLAKGTAGLKAVAQGYHECRVWLNPRRGLALEISCANLQVSVCVTLLSSLPPPPGSWFWCPGPLCAPPRRPLRLFEGSGYSCCVQILPTRFGC